LYKKCYRCEGSVEGKNLKCHTIKFNGSADIDELQAQEVEINGSFSGKNIDIEGGAEFNGKIKIRTGKLHDIQIKSTKSTIIDTIVNGNICVNVNSNGWSFNLFDFKFTLSESLTQVLELKGDKSVIGDVIFEQDGEVHLFDGSKVEVKIINAKVIQK